MTHQSCGQIKYQEMSSFDLQISVRSLAGLVTAGNT